MAQIMSKIALNHNRIPIEERKAFFIPVEFFPTTLKPNLDYIEWTKILGHGHVPEPIVRI